MCLERAFRSIDDLHEVLTVSMSTTKASGVLRPQVLYMGFTLDPIRGLPSPDLGLVPHLLLCAPANFPLK